ncbi:MAG: DUF1353 domain-containing protein [Nitriliruptorales bacterium]|nr:DUF1353 domain-containing protein [Nitriliruptorales bacterium]
MGFVHVRWDDQGNPTPGWPKATIQLEHLEPSRVGPFAKVTWRMLEPLGYEIEVEDGPDRFIVVPAHEVGQSTDLASVPPWLWGVISSFGRHTLAALLHDHLCDEAEAAPPSESGRLRRDADHLFRRAMVDLDVPAPRAWLMWAAVRLFGEGGQPGLVAKLPAAAVLASTVAVWAAVVALSVGAAVAGPLLIAAAAVVLGVALSAAAVRRPDLAGAVLVGALAGPLVAPALTVSFLTVVVIDEPAILDWASRKVLSKLPRSPVDDPGPVPPVGPSRST